MIEPVPREKIAPRSAGELSETLRRASAERLAVRIEGANTLSGMGFPLERCDITLDMRELNALIAHEVHDMTCALCAGMTLRAVDDALAGNGQFVPLDAPQRTRATVGGTIASGWRGPRRHLYGSPRELLIGIETVLSDGTPVRAGGMVVKNVAGYDMGKLYAGSFGTLGVITRANFKTLPQPQFTRALVARLPERTRSRVVAQLQTLPVPPAAALLVEGYRDTIAGEDGIDGRLFVLLQGMPNVVDRATRDLRSALGKAGVPEASIVEDGAFSAFTQIVDATVETAGERSATYRIFSLPAQAEARASHARDIAVRHRFSYDAILDAMNGDIFLRVKELDARAFDSRIELFDDELHVAEPAAVIVATRSAMRAHLRMWGAAPSGFEKMRALRERFDPNRLLNPGRFVGGL